MGNDRFKFRVWDNKHNDYLPTSDVRLDGRTGKIERASFFDDPYTIEQSTGLKDKNGKLIYEGDVIRLCEDGKLKHTAYVMWGDGRGTMSGSYIAVSTSEHDGRHPLTWYFTSHWEIIGNIHERKENT